MRTRSQSRHNSPQQEASPVIVEPLQIELLFLEDQFQEDPPPKVLIADNRAMAELLQAPTEGYEDAIVIPEITANNFELKHGLINLVQNKQFIGQDKEDPHAHIRYFNKITSTMSVPNDSLNSAAGGNFLDKMPQDRLKIIESKSKVRQSRAKAIVAKVGTSSSTPAISSEVVELKDLVRALLLDKKNQSSALTSSPTPASVKAVEPNCVTCSGTHSYQNCPATSGNVYRDNIQEYVSQAVAENYNQEILVSDHKWMQIKFDLPVSLLTKIIKTISIGETIIIKTEVVISTNLISTKVVISIKANFIDPRLISLHQAPAYQAHIPHTQSVSQTDFESYVKANDAVLRNMKNQGQNVQNQLANLTDMLSKFMGSNTAPSLGSGTSLVIPLLTPKKS
nr:reverse transcriptase domain-containing protein [Tanacetum cinerariifolium]